MRKYLSLKTHPAVSKAKTVNKRKYNFSTEDRIQKLMQVQLPKNSENKVDWTVSAYVDWHNERLERYQYDPAIYFTDLLNLDTLEKENLNHALCRFIPEVTKKCGTGQFRGATLYQMIIGIQKYLNINKKNGN